MLSVLRNIVQEVNEAQDIAEVLGIMVARVSATMKVEACAVYLADRRHNHYLLAASTGYQEGVDGTLTLKFSEGLIGLVGEREEPINLSDASSHPRYHYLPGTGEERYPAFLGVPLIHQRKLVGVLAVQQRQSRRFDEGEVAFLVTISAHLAGYVANAQTARAILDFNADESMGTTLQGNPSAPGVAVGSAVVVFTADLDAIPDRRIDDCESEIRRYQEALRLARMDIEHLRTRAANNAIPEEQQLFDAYLGILDSNTLKQGIFALIKEGHWAPFALRKVIKRQMYRFEAMEDPYLRERAADLNDLGRRVLANLHSEQPQEQKYPKETILVGEEISATALAEVPQGHLVGIVSTKGSSNSHVAILARAMGIPAVMGVTGFPYAQLENKQIIVDGYNGEVFTSPSPSMVADFRRLALEEKELSKGLDELRSLPAQTPDGVRITLCANAGLVADIRPALQAGAEGIGLYRTEVPFMIRDRFPGEEEQFLIYRQLLENFAPRPVTIRTLDIGGDKSLPYFPVKEENPFLGWRGIRVTLDHPEIFLVQLRAMLRANAQYQNLQVLFPMISHVSELDEALRLLKQAYREVVDEGAITPFPRTGVMIEVPSAVCQINALASRVDFLSVGTNDLIQYLLAVDRNNVHVSDLYEPLHPAVIDTLKRIVEAAKTLDKSVSICGEMVGDPASVIVLLGLGFEALSVNAHSIARVKWIIRNVSRQQAADLVEKLSSMDYACDIRRFLEQSLERFGLGGLVRAGK